MPAHHQPWWQDLDSATFQWQIPQDFNIATECLETADETELALAEAIEDGHLEYTFGQPDPDRGEVVAAYLVLRASTEPTDELRAELKQHVKHRLALYQYPRIIEFREGCR